MEVLSYNENTLPKNPAKLQQHLHHGSMVHLLQGMSALAKYADSVFSSVAKETSETFCRIDNLSHRVEQVQEEVAVAHENILQLSLAKMLANYKAKFALKPVVPKPIAHPSNRPFMIEESYNKAQTIPNLEKLQALDEDGKNPAKKYSDPDYFYESWRDQEVKRQQARRQQRIQREQARGESKRKKPTSIKKYRYDPFTGARILLSEAECTAPVEIQIPLPSSEVVILDEESIPRVPVVQAQPQAQSQAVAPPAASHRVVSPSRPRPQIGENQNDLPAAACVRNNPPPVSVRPDTEVFEPPAAIVPQPAPPLPPSAPAQASPSRPPSRPPSDARSALLEAIRQGPVCVLIRPPAPTTRPIKNNGDKSIWENIREKMDEIRPAWDYSSEEETGSSSEWD